MHRLSVIGLLLILTGCTLPVAQEGVSVVSTSDTASSTASLAIPTETGSLEPADIVVGESSSSAPSQPLRQTLTADGLLSIGANEAPVQMLLITNHSCDYCRDFQHALMPRLIADFVRGGDLRIDILPLNLRKYPESNTNAQRLICAAKQHRGAAMHDLLLQENRTEQTVQAGIDALGIDRTQLDTCMADPMTQQLVDSLQQRAAALNISLVPSYIINGTVYTGLPEYADLRGQVRLALDIDR